MTFRELIVGPRGVIGVIESVVVPLIMALALLLFVYGVVQYFFIGGGEPANREKGRDFIAWGVLALAIMYSVWGLVSVVLSTLGIMPR